ncbi:FAD/NAD(P)-binding domain-containing protein [Hypoxylon crocopeplum]|nr:FAD/NAD(P)-binding domain-containing protein [Hypoxylon crocopeplum]
MTAKRPFKIIVVGGEIDLDYVLLESRDEIHPRIGAAIGLVANGSFIMDQLGCYEAIKAAAMDPEIGDSHIRDGNGKSLMTLKYMHYHQEKRHGYPTLFFDRRSFLKVLYEQLKYKDRIRIRNQVDCIKPVEGGVQVTTKEGDSYLGDIVIGADGIHSDVRKEIRRIAELWNCSEREGWPGGEQCFVTGRGKSFVVVSGPNGQCHWFLFVKYSEVKYGKDIPKYSKKKDEAQFVKKHSSLKIRENLTFGQVYANRVTSALTPLHEVLFKKWSFDRMFLIGDSVHKSNPISAAEFVGTLLDEKIERGGSLDGLTVDEIRTTFGRVQDARFDRARFIISASHKLQSLIALEHPILATFALWVLMPLAGKHNFPRNQSDRIVGASRLRHLDLPSRSRAIPYDHELPAKPLSVLSNLITRALFCFVVILLIYIANITITTRHNELESGRKLPSLDSNWFGANGISMMSTSTSFYSLLALELDSAQRGLLIYLLAYMMSPLLIYTAEGYRIGRHGTIISLPFLFVASMQALGIGRSSLLYALIYAFHSAQTTVDRSVRVEVARSLVLVLVFGFIIPTMLLIAPIPSVSGWQGWNQASPLLFSALTYVLSSVLGWWQRRTSDEDVEKHVEWYSSDDVPILYIAYDMAFTVQAMAHLVIHTNLPLTDVLWSVLRPFNTASGLTTPSEKTFAILKHELFLTVVGVVSHSLYLVWELRCQGYITTSNALRAVLAVVVGQVLVGPGASWACLYRWRENIISGLSSSSP